MVECEIECEPTAVRDMARSKLDVLISKKEYIREAFEEQDSILYLGAGAGATLTLMRQLAPRSVIYAVEFAPLPMAQLVDSFRDDSKVIPILADASHPERYAFLVEDVGMIYQDVAQPEQAHIAIKNAFYFLRDGGMLIMMCKLRSINSTLPTKQVVQSQEETLGRAFCMTDVINMSPSHRDHVCFVGRYDHNNP